MKTIEVTPVGVVVERREIDSPWQDHEWRPVAVFPGAPEVDDWKVIEQGDGWTRYFAATLDLELHHKETTAYWAALANDPPVVYVILRHGEEDGEHEVEPFLVTASPVEALDILDCGEDIVEAVPMPDSILAWVQAFVDKHHVDEPFKKRKRKRHDPEAMTFGQPQPGASRRRRGTGEEERG